MYRFWLENEGGYLTASRSCEHLPADTSKGEKDLRNRNTQNRIMPTRINLEAASSPEPPDKN